MLAEAASKTPPMWREPSLPWTAKLLSMAFGRQQPLKEPPQ